jgi:sulfopyruvate decarboxylase TPP-binding subunit
MPPTGPLPNYVPPRPLSAQRMVDALRQASISHVVVIPDTYQKTFLSALEAAPDLPMIAACTEDEAVGIAAGLYTTGHRPILSIQNNGVYACTNTLRGIALDGEVPIVMIVGQYGQKAEIPAPESPLRMVRMLEPNLASWGIPARVLAADADLSHLPGDYEEALKRRGPTALIVPIPTVA